VQQSPTNYTLDKLLRRGAELSCLIRGLRKSPRKIVINKANFEALRLLNYFKLAGMKFSINFQISIYKLNNCCRAAEAKAASNGRH